MTRGVSLAVLLALPLLAQPVRAQEAPPAASEPGPTLELTPVVVTARRWSELAQDVPQSISVIDDSMIRDAGIYSIRDASFYVPNLHMTEFSARRLSFPTFRGISTGVGDPSATTTVDGVPQLKVSSTNISLLDVRHIEFLRGPQGTLYGRNSIGGLIKLETTRPTNALGVRAEGSFGNFDLQRYSISASGPIVHDRWFAGLSGLYSEREGYTKNDLTGHRVDDRRSLFGRMKLLYTPDDRNEFQFTGYGERARDGSFALGPLELIREKPHHVAVDFEGLTDRDIWSGALTWNHAGRAVHITSISALVDWEIAEEADFDFSGFDSVRRFTDESQTYFYQELRVATPADAPIQLGDQHELKWLVGGTVFSSRGSESATNAFGTAAPPPFRPGDFVTNAGDLDDLGLAVFGQATLRVMHIVDLTAGLRYDHENREADITNTSVVGGQALPAASRSESKSFDELVPALSLAYHATDDVMLYGRAARGFKAGGFNLSAPAGKTSFDTETSWTYEAGLKTSWLDDAFVLNAAYFYIDWQDLQLSLFDISSGGFIDNAGGATSQGFELESTARLIDGFEVFAGFGYTNAEFDEFVDPFGEDVAGKDLPFVPDTTFSIGAQYDGSLPLGGEAHWFLRGEYVNIGTYQLDAGNRESENFSLVNFRLGLGYQSFRIEGWIRNALDDEYVLVAFQPNPFDPTAFVGENGSPRTFGLTASYRM